MSTDTHLDAIPQLAAEMATAHAALLRAINENMAVIDRAVAARKAVWDHTERTWQHDDWCQVVDGLTGSQAMEYTAAAVIARLYLILDPPEQGDMSSAVAGTLSRATS